MKKLLSTLGIGLFILTGCGQSGPAPFDTFAQCMTDKGVIMYGNDTCPHCIDQKNDFKGSFDKITYIQCIEDFEACERAGVTSTPTWVIHDKNYVGRHSLEELAKYSGCPLLEDQPETEPVEAEIKTNKPTEATPL